MSPINFDTEVIDYEQSLSSQSDMEPEPLKRRAIQELTDTDPGARTAALALLKTLSFQIEFDDALRKQVNDMAVHDDNTFVRENAAKVLDDFADS